MLIQVLFYIFATILVLAALAVIASRNAVYSALSLVLCFVTAAAIWLLLEAEFLAVVLVLVYVGAVMVLFLFVVMMLDIDLERLREGFTRFAWLGWLTALAVIVEIVGVVWARGGLGLDATHGGTPTPAGYSNTLALGQVLYTRYAYPLELAAMLLLVAVAGIFLNRRNLILLLMCVELLLLAANFNFIAFSRYLGDLNGQVFVFFILTVAAAESAIGLAILVVLFRERRTIEVEDLNTLKG
jgi:NADH-quinone oxidoreductase subunit J